MGGDCFMLYYEASTKKVSARIQLLALPLMPILIPAQYFKLMVNPAVSQVYGLNGSGRCPSALTLERAKADCGVPGTDDMDKTHAHTVTGTTLAVS